MRFLILEGISTKDFRDVLGSILGEGAKGLSAANIVHLKGKWEDDFIARNRRDLGQKNYWHL